jgi:hypothetical protein
MDSGSGVRFASQIPPELLRVTEEAEGEQVEAVVLEENRIPAGRRGRRERPEQDVRAPVARPGPCRRGRGLGRIGFPG